MAPAPPGNAFRFFILNDQLHIGPPLPVAIGPMATMPSMDDIKLPGLLLSEVFLCNCIFSDSMGGSMVESASPPIPISFPSTVSTFGITPPGLYDGLSTVQTAMINRIATEIGLFLQVFCSVFVIFILGVSPETAKSMLITNGWNYEVAYKACGERKMRGGF